MKTEMVYKAVRTAVQTLDCSGRASHRCCDNIA